MASGIQPLTYLWSWGDNSDDTIPYPNHTYAAAGFYTICLTITDSVECTNTYCNSYNLLRPLSTNTIVSVNVVPSSSIGIYENSESEFLSIFPNPAFTSLIIKFNNTISKADIDILNSLGEIEFSNVETRQKTSIDISKLKSGVYILEVSWDDKVSRHKFIKQ